MYWKTVKYVKLIKKAKLPSLYSQFYRDLMAAFLKNLKFQISKYNHDVTSLRVELAARSEKSSSSSSIDGTFVATDVASRSYHVLAWVNFHFSLSSREATNEARTGRCLGRLGRRQPPFMSTEAGKKPVWILKTLTLPLFTTVVQRQD